MREFPNKIVIEQISASQPHVLVWIFLFVVSTWGPTSMSGGLKLWPMFARFAHEHHSLYLLGFFLVQLLLIGGAIVFLSKRYTSALWTPRPTSWRQSLNSIWILMPLLVFHLVDCISAWQWMSMGRSLKQIGAAEFNQMFSSIYQETWSPLAYGSSDLGIALESILAFISPWLEEILFSGLMANWIARQLSVALAVVITPICFSLVHGVAFGFGSQLVPLLFAGVTYTLLRFYSGNLFMSVLAHLVINFVTMFPKWLLATMYLGHA